MTPKLLLPADRMAGRDRQVAPSPHKFDPERRHLLLDPSRVAYLPAKTVLRRFPVRRGFTVVDVGCGPGYFTIPLAEIVGDSGRVYAVDVEDVMLGDLRNRAAERPGLRVDTLRSIEDEIPLPDQSVDLAFMACVLHELDGLGTLREASRVLRPSGVLGIVEWKKIKQDIGPPREHRLSPTAAGAMLRRGGFVPGRAFEVGPYHYGIVAHPQWARPNLRHRARKSRR